MTEKNCILKVGGNDMTLDELADICGISDSDGSDWDDIKEMKEEDYINSNSNKTSKQSKKINDKENIQFNDQNQTRHKAAVKVIDHNIEKVKPVVNSPITVKKSSPMLKTQNSLNVLKPTKVRVMNPSLSNETWQERIMDRTVVSASDLCKGNAAERLVDTDWILVGVVVQKSGTKRTKTDKNYSIWSLNDLQCLDNVVKFMLFGEVHEALWTKPEGTVVAILRPKIMTSDKNYKDKSFTVDHSAQVIVIGQSPDFGICSGRTNSGDKCSNIVNISDVGLCVYHIQAGYSAASNRPGFTDIRKEKLNSNKRVARAPDWNMTAKKLKTNGIMVNNTIGSKLSLEKLHKSGVTSTAAKFGVLDASAVSKMESSTVNLTEKEEMFATLLKKAGAGSKNLVTSIAQRSGNNSVLSANFTKKVFCNDRPTVAKDVTFQSICKRLEGEKINRDDPQKYIDLGMKPVQLDRGSSEFYRAELNKLRASAKAKAAGGYSNLKETMIAEHLKNVGKPKPEISAVKRKGPLSDELLKLLRQGSSHNTLATLNKEIEMEKKLDNLEKIEKVEIKMSTIHEQPCFYYFCNQCQAKSLGNPSVCVSKGHQVDKEKGFKRHFACLKCKKRLITLEKYPDVSCFKCGANVFEKTGMIKEKLVTDDKVLIDGGEKRFINN